MRVLRPLHLREYHALRGCLIMQLTFELDASHVVMPSDKITVLLTASTNAEMDLEEAGN